MVNKEIMKEVFFLLIVTGISVVVSFCTTMYFVHKGDWYEIKLTLKSFNMPVFRECLAALIITWVVALISCYMRI